MESTVALESTREGFTAQQMMWLSQTQEEVATTNNATSQVDMEAHKAPKLIIKCGLGNGLRGYHQFADHVRHIIGQTPGGNTYGKEGGMLQAIDAGLHLYKVVDDIELGREHAVVNEKGSCELLGYLAEGMIEKGSSFLDENGDLQVLVIAPVYGRHLSVLPIRDVRVHLVDPYVIMEGKPVFSPCLLRAAVQKHSIKLIVVSSAYNPSTIPMTLEDLSSCLAISQEYEAVLYVDGAYRHLYRQTYGRIPSIFQIKGALGAKVVESLSASKGHQSPGTGGMLFGNTDLIQMVRLVRKRKAEGGFVPTQIGLAATFRDTDYLSETRDVYDDYFGYMVPTWTAAGWNGLTISQTTIFIKAEVPEPYIDAGWSGETFAMLLARRGIIVYPDFYFKGFSGRPWVRICANGSRDNVDEAAEVLRALIKDPLLPESTWPESR